MTVVMVLFVVGVLVVGIVVGEIDGFWRGRMVTAVEATRAAYETGRTDARLEAEERERRTGAHRRTP